MMTARRRRRVGLVPEFLWGTAFLAGLLGSSHCVGMCGGIAAALANGQPAAPAVRTLLPLVHGCGRILSYAAAGALAATLGVAALRQLADQHWSALLRLCAASVMIIIGLNLALAPWTPVAWLRTPERWGALLWRRVMPVLSRRLPRAALPRALAAGLLWGWLPCGLVYSALLAAATSGSPLRGALTMLAFGAGTVPAVAGVGYVGGRSWLRRASGGSRRLVGAVIVVCGLWTAALPLAMLAGVHGHQHAHAVMNHGARMPP
jgi:sulfite exporter TauE/SafE